ncbi:MAG: CinA family nicotinamide mononucleotide deamidase-related protein [Vampirovibrionales bacterium]
MIPPHPHDAPSPLKIATLAVGDEVLWGEVVNTNASWLAEQVGLMGAIPSRHATVGDDPTDIFHATKETLAHCDILILTGGLGPTEDDLTLKSLAEGFGVPLVEESASLSLIASRFQALGKMMPPSNCKQAMLPYNSEAIFNPIGTAPGMWWYFMGYRKVIVALPGVPKEMKAMWNDVQARITAWAKKYNKTLSTRHTRDLWFYGIGESHLSQALGGLAHFERPHVAPYVSDDGRVRLRLSVHGGVASEAEVVFDEFVANLPETVRPFLLEAQAESLPPLLLAMLDQAGLRLAIAESCTGGGVSHAFIKEAGASAFIDANIVTYSNAAKVKYLGVDEATLHQYGAVSQQVAKAMAVGVRLLSDTPEKCVGLATTGIAGPGGGTVAKPVGLVWVAVALPSGQVFAQEARLNPLWDRASLQARFVNTACFHALQALRYNASKEDDRMLNDTPVALELPAQFIVF